MQIVKQNFTVNLQNSCCIADIFKVVVLVSAYLMRLSSTYFLMFLLHNYLNFIVHIKNVYIIWKYSILKIIKINLVEYYMKFSKIWGILQMVLVWFQSMCSLGRKNCSKATGEVRVNFQIRKHAYTSEEVLLSTGWIFHTSNNVWLHVCGSETSGTVCYSAGLWRVSDWARPGQNFRSDSRVWLRPVKLCTFVILYSTMSKLPIGTKI